MNDKYKRQPKQRKMIRYFLLPFLLLLAFCCVNLGTMAGNALFSVNTGFIESVDTQNFKIALNTILPIMDTVYNSGKVNDSIASEVSRLVKNIFEFDLASPITILNTQTPMLHTYYHSEYQELLKKNEKESIEQLVQNPTDENRVNPTPSSEKMPIPPLRSDENIGEGNQKAEEKLLEDASSISYEEDLEEKIYIQENEVTVKQVTLQNQTKYKITESDIDQMIKAPLQIKFDRKGPRVLIFHTHTTEGYLKNDQEITRTKGQISSFTNDTQYNVVRAGDVLSEELLRLGTQVMHNGTVHDYPDRNSAYGKAIGTIASYLKSYPSIKIALDIHRDGLGSDKKLRTVTEIEGKNAAKIMFVVGTDSSSLSHSKWKQNLALAVKLQNKLNTRYPGLTKPIYLSSKRYNQHMTTGSLIVEVGGDGNTIEEAMRSAKYLAKAISEVIQ